MARGRILVVEDDPRWQNTFRRLLASEGYAVVIASDYDEAVSRIENECLHLVVIDIRLVDWDTSNEEGMRVLEKISELDLDGIIQKVVVTGYGTTPLQRDAFTKYGVLDFIPKEGDDNTQGFDGRLFLQVVDDAIRNKVPLNPGLEIQLADGRALEALLDNLLPNVDINQKQEELIDLFSRLFHDVNLVTISPVARGHSGSLLLDVEPFSSMRGRSRPLMVKIDKREIINQEADNYEKYVRGRVGGSRHTDKERVAYTLHLGGIAYSLLGVSGRFTSFAQYYRSHNAEAVSAAINNLFNETCGYWYESRGHRRKRNLSSMYREQLGFTEAKLHHALQEWFDISEDQAEIKIPPLEGTFPNPIASPFVSDRPILMSAFVATTHGDLNGNNILVDSIGDTWLIDFSRTGEGHILRDFIELETAIKFELLDVADLPALQEFELALLSPSRYEELLSSSYHFKDPQLNKALSAIANLRFLARTVIAPENDMQEYYVGLFYQTLNLVRYRWLVKKEPIARRRYMLLSASLLAQKLGSWQ